MGRKVRASEYHITNTCNLRCKGCWFFAYEFDKGSSEVRSLRAWRQFVCDERERGVTAPLLIGGEPSLFLDRVRVFVEEMPFVTLSTNGLIQIPVSGFEDVGIAVTLFGGVGVDDELRGHKPGGSSVQGLFETALKNYRNDPRVCFIVALNDQSVDAIPETVQRIEDNGNRLSFNYYSTHGGANGIVREEGKRVMDAALSARQRHPEAVTSHPYFIRTLVSGSSHFGSFGYEVCPSISSSHSGHAERRRNGHASLPLFNSYAADLKTINFCCSSGRCESCRDSQAVYSWLLGSLPEFLGSESDLRVWIELAEDYWRQYPWVSKI